MVLDCRLFLLFCQLKSGGLPRAFPFFSSEGGLEVFLAKDLLSPLLI